MTLKKKLTKEFVLLFIILINVFGIILTILNFNRDHKDLLDSMYEKYMDEQMFLDDLQHTGTIPAMIPETIEAQLKAYIRNSYSIYSEGAVTDLDGKVICSTFKEGFVPSNGFKELKGTNVSYSLQPAGSHKDHYCTVRGKIILFDKTYTLYYGDSIIRGYRNLKDTIKMFLVLDVILAVISYFLIYRISESICAPLHALSEMMDLTAKESISKEVTTASGIVEIDSLSEHFDQMNLSINEKIAELQERNEEKERFIHALTHEIRTPLTAIIGFSSLMKSGKEIPDEKKESCINLIYDNGKRIEQLTTDLIRLLNVDKTELVYEEFSVNDIAHEIEKNYEERIQQDNIGFMIKGEAVISSDRNFFMILLQNVIDNAIKAVEKKTEAATRLVQVEISSDRVIVSDTGIGIPPEDMGKIFEPFFMEDKSRRNYHSGFGMGLALCDRIMKALSITPEIESTPGKGTSFTLKFCPLSTKDYEDFHSFQDL